MAQNPTPNICAELIDLGGDMVGGLGALATSLGITQITAAQMQTAVTAYSNADLAFNTARTMRQTHSDAFQAADVELKDWLIDARAVLTTHLGRRWSNMWVEAGFMNHSTAVPTRIAQRIALAASLVNYFTAHPTQQAPTTGVTAAAASDLHYAITTAQLTLNAAKTDLEVKKVTRMAKCQELRMKMRLLINTLKGILPGNDGRWSTFGLNLPAAAATPAQPQNVTVMALPGHTLLAQCDATPLATRYRWRIKVVGVDESYRLAVSTLTRMAEITEVMAGQQVSLIVQAVNGPAQSVASEPVEVTVVAATAPTPPAPAPEEIEAPHSHSNGKTPATNGRSGTRTVAEKVR